MRGDFCIYQTIYSTHVTRQSSETWERTMTSGRGGLCSACILILPFWRPIFGSTSATLINAGRSGLACTWGQSDYSDLLVVAHEERIQILVQVVPGVKVMCFQL